MDQRLRPVTLVRARMHAKTFMVETIRKSQLRWLSTAYIGCSGSDRKHIEMNFWYDGVDT